LFFDAAQGADGYVSFGVWYGDPSRFVVVLELSMTAFSSNFKPTIGNQLYNHVGTFMCV